MTSGHFFFDDGKSRKFWSYSLQGKTQTIRHGRIGTKGRETTKMFPSAPAAEAATAKLISHNLVQGYIQVDPGKLKFHRDKKKWKRPATKAEVASLERRLQARLPTDYKEFLLTQNGGFPVTHGIGIPGDPQCRSIEVGEIYGLYDEPKGFTLLWALDQIQPRLPSGHLPISGWLDFCSISLKKNAGSVYFWDEFAAPRTKVDGEGETIFNGSHAVLVAGSFNEFLTRLAISKDPDEPADPEAMSAGDEGQGGSPQKRSPPRSNDFIRNQLQSREKTRLSQRRQAEILRLTYEGGDELTAAYEQGEKAGETFRRKIHRKIMAFVKATTNKYELHFFADNWHWDAGGKPLLALVKNPYVDAGTLLQIFWNGSAEDYYLFHRSVAEIDSESDREVFRVLLQIERRIVKGDVKTAAILFDPTERISMPERRSEFARPIPEVMYQPILGGKLHKG